MYLYLNTHWVVHLCVYGCISEDKVWTTIGNDLPAQSSVAAGSGPEDKTVLTLNYSMSAEQVMLKTVWI